MNDAAVTVRDLQGVCARLIEPHGQNEQYRLRDPDTYVDLRMATLLAGVDQIPLAERDRILAEHGVGEQDLLDFVDLRGGDPDYMHAVWDSVEARIDRLRAEINAPAPEGYTPPDSTGS